MAETTTKIFTVDTGKAITNLKEYKAYLDDLKGALLGLEQGTDEYNQTAKALRDGQQKLNEVMDVAKGKNTEAADSYDALNKRLVELRRSYRALSEENREGIVGKRMLDGIQELDQKLKGIDADMGQYFRNVGDYRNAFADAFDKALGPMGKVGGAFGRLANDVKGMIPLIKSVNSTAITGLSGIKAAIASTGIGLLIVAVGELAANWENVTNWLKNAVVAQDDYATSLKNTQTAIDHLSLKIAEFNKDADEVEKQRKILFEGYTEVTFAEERLTQATDAQTSAIGQLETANSDLSKAYEKVSEAQQKVKGSYSAAMTEVANLELQAAQDNLVTAMLNQSKAMKNLQDATDGVKTSSQNLANAKEKEAQATKKNNDAHKQNTKTYDNERQAAEKLMETINDAFLDDLGKLDKEYERNARALKAYLDGGIITADEYAKAMENLGLKYVENFDKINKGIQDAFQSDEIAKVKEQAEAAVKKINEDLKGDQTTLKLRWRLEDSKEALKPENMGIQDFFKTLFSNDDIDKWAEEQQQRISDLYGPQIAASETLIKQYDAEIAKLKELGATEEEIEAVEAQKRQEELNHLTLKTEKEIESNELIDEKEQQISDRRQQRFKVMTTGMQAVGNLLNNLSSMMTNQIQQEVKEGKISEAEAKKKFKTIKAMQYASAVMTTAAGVAAALAGVFTTKSGPWDYVLAGIQAASIAAGGAIQIATIARQKFDTSGGGNSITTPNLATVTNEYKPEYVQNIQTQSELSELSNAMGQISPVVTVTDIEDGLQTNKVRVEENSF